MFRYRVWFGEIAILVDAYTEKDARVAALPCESWSSVLRKRITWVEKLDAEGAVVKILEF